MPYPSGLALAVCFSELQVSLRDNLEPGLVGLGSGEKVGSRQVGDRGQGERKQLYDFCCWELADPSLVKKFFSLEKKWE